MAYNYNGNGSGGTGGGANGSNDELISWLIVVAGLVFFWPVGLFLLFRKLNGNPIEGKSARQNQSRGYESPYAPSGADQKSQAGPTQAGPKTQSTGSSSASYAPPGSARDTRKDARYQYKYSYRYNGAAGGSAAQTPGMQGVPNQGRSRRKNVDLNKGKAMTVWGGILTGIFGFAAMTSLPIALIEEGLITTVAMSTPLLGFLGLGVMLLYMGAKRNKKAKRFRKYLALIGRRDSISISSLAQAMPVSYRTACDDLQEMLDEGYIPTGYLDMASGRLMLTDDGLREEAPQPEEEETPEVVYEEEAPVDNSVLLDEIKQINDSIADEEMSRKIDRIGEITAKILEYQRKNPNKAGQLRSFLSYYLPTTLKILRAYAQMEAQGIEGENIRSAKTRIEGMMDKVVEGFEKQLDKLFQDDAMDITTDVEVLERMLDKDGLSGTGGPGDLFQMGG